MIKKNFNELLLYDVFEIGGQEVQVISFGQTREGEDFIWVVPPAGLVVNKRVQSRFRIILPATFPIICIEESDRSDTEESRAVQSL
jgi:hypothetical protein